MAAVPPTPEHVQCLEIKSEAPETLKPVKIKPGFGRKRPKDRCLKVRDSNVIQRKYLGSNKTNAKGLRIKSETLILGSWKLAPRVNLGVRCRATGSCSSIRGDYEPSTPTQKERIRPKDRLPKGPLPMTPTKSNSVPSVKKRNVPSKDLVRRKEYQNLALIVDEVTGRVVVRKVGEFSDPISSRSLKQLNLDLTASNPSRKVYSKEQRVCGARTVSKSQLVKQKIIDRIFRPLASTDPETPSVPTPTNYREETMTLTVSKKIKLEQNESTEPIRVEAEANSILTPLDETRARVRDKGVTIIKEEGMDDELVNIKVETEGTRDKCKPITDVEDIAGETGGTTETTTGDETTKELPLLRLGD